ncbi:MAG TPA: thioredoxin family protein [Thermoguttaceae bacterium]|nr:thioredoxin family protein [Thermoguttaceae bacterium]
MLRRWELAVVAVAVTLLLAACSSQAAPLAELKIGAPAPDWSGIIGIDDKEHGLADCKKAKIVVMVFTCNHCPVAIAYEDRLVALQKDYKKKGVQLIAVNVNNLKADTLEPMKVRAKEKEFNFPYLYDPTQKMGRDYGAKVTPHVFVLDKDREIAYVGAVDDNNNPKKAEKQHLRDALDALLAGEKPATAETTPRGCSVKYEN